MNTVEKAVENEQGVVESEALIIIGEGEYKPIEDMECIHFTDRKTGTIIPQVRINFLHTFMHNEHVEFKRIYLN